MNSPAKHSFYSRYGLTIMLVVFFLLPIAVAGARRALLSNKNDVKQWLPARYEETQVYERFQKHFQNEEFVLVSWDGCTLDDPRLELMATKLRAKAHAAAADDDGEAHQSYFSRVMTGPDSIAEMTEKIESLSYEEARDRLIGSLVGPDKETTCIVLTLSAYGSENARKAVDKIEDVAVSECAIPAANLHMGGPPVDNAAIDKAGESTLVRLALMSGAIGLLVSWWSLRSKRLVALVMFTGIYSIIISMAIVYYSGTPMNAILLSMPSLVYVTATSGAIHLANYYRDTVAEHGTKNAALHAIQHAWLPLSLATVTTAVGLVSLCMSELVPIQLFGIFSAIGVVVSLLLLFLFLPAGLEMWPIRVPKKQEGEPAETVFSRFWWRMAERVVRHHNLVAVATLLVMAVCAYGLVHIKTSVSMMRFFQKGAPILNDYTWLEKHLGELVPVEIVLSVPKDSGLSLLDQMRLVDRVQSKVNEIPEVGSSLSTVTFGPSLRSRTRRIPIVGRVEDPVLNKRLTKNIDEFLAGDYLRETSDALLWRISARVGALKNVDYAQFIDVLKQEVEPIVSEQEAKLAQAPPAGGVALVADAAARPNIDVVYTGLVPIVYKAQTSLLDGLVTGFVSDLVLIILVMIIAVRSMSAGILLTITSIFPALIVFGLMGWWDIVVDVGTVMTPAVALGVTVDDVVHFMLWFRRGIADGLSRNEAVMLAYKGCGRAMYQSWGVIGLGLSVFAFSPFTPTQRFGFMMLTLLTAALPGNLLLMPALLAGPLGRLFERGIRPAKQPAPAKVALPPHAKADNPHRRRDPAPSVL
jgi:predicted RND superfamily exporter protein